ncbi:MAG: zinc-ribbon domain-containing protein [Spirochaetes bacterium]|nr:zinc-ribbon domain-containing protein [Spirochaetota bacterium]
MNNNLLNIIKEILAKTGDTVLSEPRRVSAFLSDLAQGVPKPQKTALIKCLEHGFAQVLKNVAEAERARCKQSLAQRLHEKEGLDLALCEKTLELLAAVFFGEEPKIHEKNHIAKPTKLVFPISQPVPLSRVTSVAITNYFSTIDRDKTLEFYAKVNGENNPPKSVDWKVSGNTSSQTYIDSSGVLSVAANENSQTLTITASSTFDPSRSCSVTVTITSPPNPPKQIAPNFCHKCGTKLEPTSKFCSNCGVNIFCKKCGASREDADEKQLFLFKITVCGKCGEKF